LTYGSGHVHGLLLDGQEVVGFERDALHREVHRLQANGLEQSQAYDPVGRLLEQQLLPHAQRPRDREAWRIEQLGQGIGSRLGQAASLVRRYRYDAAGQLSHLEDSRRGRIEYRYDPVGRLLRATSALGAEAFAFDPAGNLVTPQREDARPADARRPLPQLLDNLLKDYAGTRYRYDARGNLVERVQPGRTTEFEWDGFNRMVAAVTLEGAARTVTRFSYDPLGRRIGKLTERSSTPGQRSHTVYGWDGDVLAFESSSDGPQGHTVHYVHEAGSFVPLLQASRAGTVELAPTTDIQALKAANFGEYDHRLDPLWNGEFDPKPKAFAKEEIAFYQCDHLGTPQELTDHEGKVAWEASYKAWGEAKQAISQAAQKAGFKNPIRFQGQYLDEETGLHYNRYRYYDPESGRFVSRDPIGLLGGLNLHAYAPNAVQWIDPFGLSPVWDCNASRWRDSSTGRFRGRPTEAVKTAPNQAFFWSGRTNGVGGEHVAKQVATANGGTTLELQLTKNGVVMPPWDASNPAAVREWEEMSRSYAQQACGLTRGVIGQDLRPGNVWEGREKGALMANRSVTQIDQIDPQTGATKTIFKR
jgi:RHS repeat-associated protein